MLTYFIENLNLEENLYIKKHINHEKAPFPLAAFS